MHFVVMDSFRLFVSGFLHTIRGAKSVQLQQFPQGVGWGTANQQVGLPLT
jgi:hypothetical protein